MTSYGRCNSTLCKNFSFKAVDLCAECKAAPPPQRTNKCRLCGKPCFNWQVFCGANCCARYEAGERPKE